MPLNRETLLTFLEKDLGVDVFSIEDYSPLFSSGLIDSFSLVSLIGFIEKQGSFRMGPEDVNLENLDSIERIVDFSAKMESTAVD